MKRKGFTLIELLAVIVILAVIALIATPAVLNIIEDSKRSSAEDSARIIAKEAETYYMSETSLEGNEVGDIDLTGDTLQYKGEKPSKGYVTFNEQGNAYLKMYMNGYCIESDYDNTVTSEKTEATDCTMGTITIPLNLNGGTLDVTSLVAKVGSPLGELPTPTREDYIFAGWYTEGDVLVDENTLARENLTLTAKWTKGTLTVTLDDGRLYANGEAVYFNPVTNEACLSTEYNATTNSTDGFRGTADNGCMLWRAFLDSNDDITVKLLLDHNTSSNMTFNEAKTEITNVKDNNLYGWHEDVRSTVRMISAEEIIEIAPYKGPGTWTAPTEHTYHLHTGTSSIFYGAKGTNKYGWLFDNLRYCEAYGCNVEQDDSQRYFTSTYFKTQYNSVWAVAIDRLDIEVDAGIRPVIEVPKDLLSPKKEVAYGETYGEIPTITREGYTFTGWHTTGGTDVTSDTIYQLTTDSKLYAQWQVNTYTVTFKNGDEVVSTKTVTYNQPYGTLPSDQVKDGYLFKGWKKNDYTAITSDTIVTTANNHDIETVFVEKTYLEELYFNPVTNQVCNRENDADKYHIDNSLNKFTGSSFEGYDYNEVWWNTMTDNQTGCMKWYVYKEDGDNYLMILDHSTSSWMSWDAAQTEIANVKDNNSYSWHAGVYPTARLISAEEVNGMAPYSGGTWTVTSDSAYYLHTGTYSELRGVISGTNKYGWLFDNTDGCDTYGCNVAQDDSWGYWTSSAIDAEQMWAIESTGKLHSNDNNNSRSIRPVISVPKSKFN